MIASPAHLPFQTPNTRWSKQQQQQKPKPAKDSGRMTEQQPPQLRPQHGANQLPSPLSPSTMGAPVATTANTTLLDALPYIDPVNEDYEQYALALIEAEMQQQQSTNRAGSADQSVPDRHVHHSQLFQEAVQQLCSDGDDDTAQITTSVLADHHRATFPTAPASSDSVETWAVAVQHAQIAYESQRLRALQLQVPQDNGEALWRRYTDTVLQPQYQAAQVEFTAQQEAVERINAARLQHQTETLGRPLHVWTVLYEELMVKQRQLQQAIAQLEAEEASVQ